MKSAGNTNRNGHTNHSLKDFVLTMICFCLTATSAHGTLKLQTVNQNPNYHDTNVYISFGGAAAINGIINGKAILLGTNYTASELNKGCFITNFSGGAKIFVSLGRPLESGTSGDLFARNFNNYLLPDYYTRWDKIELSYMPDDTSSCANLTADDFTSIPLKIDNGSGSMSWHYSHSMGWILTNLAALCNFNAQSVATTNGNIVRVISPHTSFTSPWPSPQSYLDYVKTNNIKTSVSGDYYGRADINTGPWKAQAYDLKAFINPGGDLVLTGQCTVVGQTTITISNATLLEAFYSANPGYLMNSIPSINSNTVYDAAIRDILAGFNLGLVGTTKIDPRTSVAFSNETTKVWFNYPANGVVTSSLHYTNVFCALWPTNLLFYNQYAGILSTNTDAYGFPFNDTLAKPLLPLLNNPTLTITILADSPGSSSERFSSISLSNGLVFMTLTNLVPGTTNSIDRTFNMLNSNGWQNATNFVPASKTIIYTETATTNKTFYRARRQ